MILDSFTYSIPYIVFLLYYIFLYFIENHINFNGKHSVVNLQIIKLASLIGIVLFFGLRGFIGWDWTTYYPTFKTIPVLFSLKGTVFTETRYEPGFVIYISIIKTIWNNYFFFDFISTLIDIVILIAIIRQFSGYSYSLVCLVFIVMGGFYLETDLMRNAKSIMLFLLSLKYLKERRILPYYMLNILGCLFHFSSLIFLPLYFFLHKIIPRKAVIIIFIIGTVIFLLRVEYIIPIVRKVASFMGENTTIALNKYLKNSLYSSGYGLTVGFAERMITSSLIIIYYDKILKRKDSNVLFINSFIIFFIFFFYFAEVRIIPIRVGGLFAFSYWILYPAILEAIENRNNRSLFLSFIFIYSLIKIAGMTDTILYRYDNVLFRGQAYETRQKIFDKTSPYFLK